MVLGWLVREGETRDKVGNGEQIRHHHVWDGPRTGVSDRLPSSHPVTTSAHETVRRGDCCGFVSEGDEQDTQLWVVLRFRRWSYESSCGKKLTYYNGWSEGYLGGVEGRRCRCYERRISTGRGDWSLTHFTDGVIIYQVGLTIPLCEFVYTVLEGCVLYLL